MQLSKEPKRLPWSLLFLILTGRRRFRLGTATLTVGLASLAFLPDKWFERMATIEAFQQDRTAMGRSNVSQFAYNPVKDHSATGGEFVASTVDPFRAYAPDPDDIHGVHRIYFEMLAEHGFVRLALYLMLAMATWGAARWTVRHARGDPALAYHADLARMTQVSFVGYAVGDGFLGLAYFDLLCYPIAIVAANHMLLKVELEKVRPLSVTPLSLPLQDGASNTPAQSGPP